MKRMILLVIFTVNLTFNLVFKRLNLLFLYNCSESVKENMDLPSQSSVFAQREKNVGLVTFFPESR